MILVAGFLKFTFARYMPYKQLSIYAIARVRGGLAMLAFGQCPVGWQDGSDKRVIFVWKTGDFLDFAKVGPVGLEWKLGRAGRVEVENCPVRF